MIELLSVEDLCVEIAGRPIVEGASLELPPGRLTAIVGPNGAGKSTLVRAIAGVQKFTSGSVGWGERDLTALPGRDRALIRAFVPQRAQVPPGVTVHEAVAIGRSVHIRPWQRAREEDRDAIASSMQRAGVEQLAGRMLATLSGGELQRVQIAVALAQAAPLLIADEPTSALDLGATVKIAMLLRGLADDGYSVLLVVHDLSLAAAIADEVVVMSQGRAVAAGEPHATLTPELLERVWGVGASLEVSGDERTALHVNWLGGAERPPADE